MSSFECRILRSDEEQEQLFLNQKELLQPQNIYSEKLLGEQQYKLLGEQQEKLLGEQQEKAFQECVQELQEFDIKQFIFESKQLIPNHEAWRQNDAARPRRTAGACGTFAIFPFLAFLYAASTFSTNVINTVNNSNNNENNNNNNNTNININMNVNMNTRRRRETNSSMFDEIFPSLTGRHI